MILFIIFLLIILIVALMLLKPSGVLYIRLLSLPVLCILFVLCLIILSNTAIQAAINGLRLWAGIVVPSLFPFFVAAEVMNSTGFIRAAGTLLEPVMRPFFNVPGCGSFPFAMGITSGYPVGAKITCDFRKNGDLTKTEAERLLAFTNNSGPLFIAGAVGAGMYGSTRLGIFLFVSHFLACITVGFLFRFYKRNSNQHDCRSGFLPQKSYGIERQKKAVKREKTFTAFRKTLMNEQRRPGTGIGTILGDAIRNSITTILAIGGFIVLFSVIIHLLEETGIISGLADAAGHFLLPAGVSNTVIKGVLSGFFEITTGSNMISSAAGSATALQLPVASFIIGWAGLSVHFQVMSIAAGTDVSIRPYLFGKLLQGILSGFYTWLGLKIFRSDFIFSEPVLGEIVVTPARWLNDLGSSLLMLLYVLAFFVILTLVARISPLFAKHK